MQALALADLIDEYPTLRAPVLWGDGKPSLAKGARRQAFELARIKPYSNGVARMSYTRKAAA